MLPVKLSTGRFLKKRFVRIGIPMIIWTLLYVIQVVMFNTPERTNLLFSQAPFISSINTSFWFLYTLFGLYLISPIISKWLVACSRRELECYLALWVIISTFPYPFHISGASIETNSPFYYVNGYVGFYVLGYYFRRYHSNVSTRLLVTAVVVYLCVDIPMPCFERFLGMEIITGAQNYYLGNVLRTAAIFLAIFYFFSKFKSTPLTATLSKLTFGVYLINEWMNLAMAKINPLPGASPCLRLVVASGVVIVASFALVYLISYLPGSKYYIAYHHK